MAVKDLFANLLDQAGVSIGGQRPYDIQINDERLYKRVSSMGSLGAGEGYMDAWWDCEQLDEFFFRISRIDVESAFNKKWMAALKRSYYLIVNMQTRLRSLRVAENHYNLGNDLYTKMLGPSMAYTCAYWKNACSLDEAQFNKFDLICRKIHLKPGERVLDLGCGWGSLAKYAAEKYGVHVTGVNISTEQIKYARESCLGLPVEFYLCDYRDDHIYNPKGQPFDKVMSVGLCEHVGVKNYSNFILTARRNMKESGLFLLHTIGRNDSSYFVDPWINKYIFPNGMLPSIQQLSKVIENVFILEDLHNFGADYDKTLMEWHKNFVRHWDSLKDQYDDQFYRLWNYYLLSCAGAFRARTMQLWQIVLSPKGIIGGYETVR